MKINSISIQLAHLEMSISFEQKLNNNIRDIYALKFQYALHEKLIRKWKLYFGSALYHVKL